MSNRLSISGGFFISFPPGILSHFLIKMKSIKIALQKSGRLSEKSIQLLESCGIQLSNGERKLKAVASNYPIEILFLRDDDIPQYVEQGVADLGILGENEVWEQNKNVSILKPLGFAKCRMALAIPKEENYTDLSYFASKKIATSYPGVLSRFFAEKNIPIILEPISGSVEIAPGIGLADAVFDIVSTGSTLLMNGLKEVATVCSSQAVLIANPNLSAEQQELVDNLLFRIDACQQAKANKYILLNAPNEQLETIIQLLPGIKSPTVMPLALSGWSSIHAVLSEKESWSIIEQLKKAGAEGILVIPMDQMVA